jgi:hypothetical protein
MKNNQDNPTGLPDMVMNIPQRLSIEEFPEISVLPFNILFTTLDYGSQEENVKVIVHYALYEPDFKTYLENSDTQEMSYFNVLNRNFWAKIIYKKSTKCWEGYKFSGEKEIGSAFGGPSWEMFFVHFTLLGCHLNLNK